MIGNDDIVGIPDHIGQRGAAEPAVDDRISGKVIAYVLPFPERRTADKQNGVGRRELNTVVLFEFVDFIRKGLGQAVGKGQRGQQQQKGSQHFHDHDFDLLRFNFMVPVFKDFLFYFNGLCSG
jgi:hypothetical protein